MFMKNKKGFTLVELLVVIAIIAILAAVVAPNAFKAIEKSKITAIEADYRAIKTATLMYYSDIGEWPETPTVDGDDPGFIVAPKVTDPDAPPATIPLPSWNGPYLDVWTDESPLGAGYVFVNEDDEADWIDGEANAVYLQITNLPQSAYDRLIEDLGDTVVFVEDDTFATAQNVNLKIASK
jgi:general secretion pathway protein G